MPCTSCTQPKDPLVRRVRLIALGVVLGILALGVLAWAVGAMLAA